MEKEEKPRLRTGSCRFGTVFSGMRVCKLALKPCCMVENCPDGRAGLQHGRVTLDMVRTRRAAQRRETP